MTIYSQSVQKFVINGTGLPDTNWLMTLNSSSPPSPYIIHGEAEDHRFLTRIKRILRHQSDPALHASNRYREIIGIDENGIGFHSQRVILCQ